MTANQKIHLVMLVVMSILIGIFIRGCVEQKRATKTAEAVTTVTTQIVKAKDAAIAQRDAATQAVVAAAAVKAAAIRTPKQAATAIAQYLPASEGAEIVTVPNTTLPPEVREKVPDAPEVALVRPQQLEQLAKDEITCSATRAALSSCQADNADRISELAAMKRESDAWKKAAKGGTKWQRFGHVIKLVGCAAGGAGVGALVDRTDPAGAAIGGAAGVTACSLF